jgi:arylsulfatase A-like enzyme
MEPHWPYSEGLPYVDRFGNHPGETDFSTVDWKAFHRRLEDDPESIPETDRNQLVSLYDGAIRAVDERIGVLLRELEERGLRDRILFVITADHGEEFGEHGRYGHIRTVFDTLLRVPLIFEFPGSWKAGLSVDQQVRLVDVMPTLLDAIGADPPVDLLGRSLLPMIRNGGHDPLFPRYAFSEFMWSDTYLRHSVRTNEYKLIRTFNRGSGSEAVGRDVPPADLASFLDPGGLVDFKVTRGLYDMIRDPGERFNLFRQQRPPAVAEELESVLDDWLRANAALFDAEEPETLDLRGDIIERLEGLGYLQ